MATITEKELFSGMQNETLKLKSDDEYLSMKEIQGELVSYGLQASAGRGGLKNMQRTVLVRVWHDHATLAGASHYSVMVQDCL